MKTIGAVIFLAIGLNSCEKKNVGFLRPLIFAKSDTSTTPISHTELVGNWNIVTDTVYLEGSPTYPGSSFKYYGTPSDHYIFTKYANMYIKSAFNNYTDTAVYIISGTDTLKWINSYFSQAGSVIKGPSQTGAFIIMSISPHSLIISQSGLTPEGHRYEEITFKK
jgi:hypothetical protein